MKSVLFLFLIIVPSISFSQTVHLDYELELHRPFVKDPIFCRVTLTIRKVSGISCYYQDIVVGKDEDCDLYYEINGILVETDPLYRHGHKLISAEDALRLLSLVDVPDACQ